MCLITYGLGTLALVLALPARRDGRVVGEALLRPDGRLAFAGWAVATVLLGTGVVAAESALDHRERDRVAGLLGTPAPAPVAVVPPSAAPLVSPGPGGDVARFQEEARVATEQARRLQEILDDPRKLEQYFAEKAAREFEQGPVHALKLEGAAYKGPAQAPIRVTEFSDFLCPFCKNIAGAFQSYLPGTAGRVSVYFKNYPLDTECNPNLQQSIHPGACNLARGGLCAHEQGRFWPYHDKVFFGPELANPSKADVVRIAGEAGLDAAALQTCIDSPRIKEKLAAEIAEGKSGGVAGTPTLFVNGKRLPRINDLTQTVEKEAQKLGLPPLPASN
jgi:protein-disulfide isomerase